MTTTTSSNEAAMLRSVLAAPHPRLALPDIAHRHDVTLVDLQAVLNRHGYPDQVRMRAAVAALEALGDVDDRPATTVSVSTPSPTTTTNTDGPITIVDLLTKARASSSARTRNKAAKVDQLLGELRAAMAEDAAREAARAEVVRLERELAEARAKLRGPAPTPPAVGSGKVPCGCGKEFNGTQGLALHRRRTGCTGEAS